MTTNAVHAPSVKRAATAASIIHTLFGSVVGVLVLEAVSVLGGESRGVRETRTEGIVAVQLSSAQLSVQVSQVAAVCVNRCACLWFFFSFMRMRTGYLLVVRKMTECDEMQPASRAELKPRGCTARTRGDGGGRRGAGHAYVEWLAACSLDVSLHMWCEVEANIRSALCPITKGVARAALHVHEAVLVYAQEEQHQRC